TSSTRAASGSAATSKTPASISTRSLPTRPPPEGIMETSSQRRRGFVSGQLVEYWEHPDVAFGWTHEHLQTYADREDCALLLKAILVTCTRPGTENVH